MILWKLIVLLNVLKNFFNTYLDWFFSWFLNLESWILILETWFLKTSFLNLWNFLDSWFFGIIGIIKITLEDIASTHTNEAQVIEITFHPNLSKIHNKQFVEGRTPPNTYQSTYRWISIYCININHTPQIQVLEFTLSRS